MKLPFNDFDIKSNMIKTIYKNKGLLDQIKYSSNQTITPELVKDIYGDLYFPQPPKRRPYLYASYVFSFDGKIGFSDNPLGFLVSQKNLINPKGAEFDFWMLNLLRAYADMVILGGRTLCQENDTTGHVYDRRLAEIRVNKLQKNNQQPICLVISSSGKNIPLEHRVFKSPQLKTWIHTSPRGKDYLLRNNRTSFEVIMEKDIEKLDSISCDDLPNKTIFCTGEKNSTDVLSFLRLLRKVGIEKALIEPSSYSWLLMKNSLLDELFINYSGIYAGGDLTLGRHLPFQAENHPHVRILKMDMCPPNFIYTRQKLIYGKHSKEERNDV